MKYVLTINYKKCNWLGLNLANCIMPNYVMRNNSFFLILTVTLIFLFSSCYKEFHLPVEYEPKIVVVGVLVPGRDVQIQLMSNFSTHDSAGIVPLLNASASLYHGETLLGSLTHLSSGVYTIETLVQEGETYTLRAACQGFPSIEATTNVPISQEFIVEREVEEFFYPQYNQYAYDIFVNLTLPSVKEPSYYGFCYYNVSQVFVGAESKTLYQLFSTDAQDKFVEFFDCSRTNIYGYDKLKDFTDINTEHYLRTYFPDDWEESSGSKFMIFICNEPFSGLTYTLNNYLGRNSTIDVATHMNIYQLSPELYKTFKGIAAQEATNNGMFVSPVPAHNSVKGGLGYFGAALVHTVEFEEDGFKQ